MINTLVLDTVAVEPTFVVSFSPRKHTSMASRAILWNFFEKQWTKNHPQYLSRLSRALFPTTFLETAVYNYLCYHFKTTLFRKGMFKIQNVHHKTDTYCTGHEAVSFSTGWISQLSVIVNIICVKCAETSPSFGVNKAKEIKELCIFLQVLTKSYKMKCEPDDDDPFSFEGPEIISTSGYVYCKTV